MFTYQKTNRFFAQIAGGLEELGSEELVSLGAYEVKPIYRGIYFKADKYALYRIIYMSRLCSRILALLLRFDCHSTKYLYKTAMNIDWHELLSKNSTFAVFATVSNSKINHSQYAALCLKDAIVDYCRNKFGARPNVDTRNPDIRFNLHIENNKAAVSIDMSGGSLHRRGYRQVGVEAPMQETLAAAIIRLTGWQGEQPLLDPMCGSGTLLGEALMHYCRIPAGGLRNRFGFEMMHDYDAIVWKQVQDETAKQIRQPEAGLIRGSDMDRQAVMAAATNLKLLPHGQKISLKTASFQNIGKVQNSIIVSNPPYGIRLTSKGGMVGFMQELGRFLKQQCRGSTAYIYFGKRELSKKIGLKSSWKKPLKHGGLDGILVKYVIY